MAPRDTAGPPPGDEFQLVEICEALKPSLPSAYGPPPYAQSTFTNQLTTRHKYAHFTVMESGMYIENPNRKGSVKQSLILSSKIFGY